MRAQPWGPTPSISGTAQVDKTLTANPGTWAPVATSLDYQWYADGQPVGADSRTLRLTPLMAGRRITVSVEGSVPGEQIYTNGSAATAKVAKGGFVHTRPRIAGKAVVGHRLTARPGSWSPKASLSYRWYLDGKAVKGATKKRWKIPAKARHHRVTVRVTARRPGYVTTVVRSKPTKKVRRVR